MVQLVKCLSCNHEDLSLIFCSLVKAEWTWWIMPGIPAIRGGSRRIGSRSSSDYVVSVRPYLQKQNKTKAPMWKLANRFSQNTFSKKYSESTKGRHNIWPPYLHSRWAQKHKYGHGHTQNRQSEVIEASTCKHIHIHKHKCTHIQKYNIILHDTVQKLIN